MIKIDIEDAGRTWDIAETAPRDQVEYVVTDDGSELIRSYDSVRTFVKLYECACFELESSEHPSRPVFDLTRTEDGIRVEIRQSSFTTTFERLCAESESAMAEIFRSLDENSEPDERDEAMERMNERHGYFADVRDTYRSISTEE